MEDRRAFVSTEQHVRSLKDKRRAFKTQITNLKNYVQNFEDSMKERIKLRERLERLRAQFKTFNEIQDELSSFEEFDVVEAERDATTNAFDDAIASAIALKEQLDSPAHLSVAPVWNSVNVSPTPSSTIPLEIHLSKSDLPKFDGRLEKWIKFKNAFQTMIDSDPTLNDIQKLHYLRQSLSGSAENGIELSTISADNYKAAWTQLVKTYDNTRALALRHAALLLETPATRDDSVESIRELINHMQANVRSLDALGPSWEDIAKGLLSSIVISKLGRKTRKDWEQALSCTTLFKFEDIIKHVWNSSHRGKQGDLASSSAEPVEPVAGSSRNEPRHDVKAVKRRMTTPPYSAGSSHKSVRTSSQEYEPCKICRSREHTIYRCNKLVSMKVDARIAAVRNARLCLNCLTSDHTAEDCILNPCRICGQRHNFRLHPETE